MCSELALVQTAEHASDFKIDTTSVAFRYMLVNFRKPIRAPRIGIVRHIEKLPINLRTLSNYIFVDFFAASSVRNSWTSPGGTPLSGAQITGSLSIVSIVYSAKF